ncbi:MAG: hypothetical protein P8179_17655 [Candidatus Thiodiazotropha sp.]
MPAEQWNGKVVKLAIENDQSVAWKMAQFGLLATRVLCSVAAFQDKIYLATNQSLAVVDPKKISWTACHSRCSVIHLVALQRSILA